MAFIYRLLAAILAFALAAPALAQGVPATERTAPWNAETSDLEADTSIIYGRLPNGLIYAIRPNNRPQNQVLVRLAFDFGSAAETEDEQGLAHFIEHMAFNGTSHVPEGEMVKMLERLGLSFGADTNASTGYVQTQYKLDLPKADPALIERSLFLLRETASEVLFDPDAVDRERGVVIAEMRVRESFGFQSTRASNNLFYPDSYYATRYPIGKLDILQNAPASRMKKLYQKWYRPDRARIVIVGPVDPVAMEKLIAEKFGDWKAAGPPLGDIDQCSFDTQRPIAAALFTHPEVTEGLTIRQLLPDGPRPDNLARALLQLRMAIADQIVQKRIARRSRAGDIPFLGGGTSFSAGFCDKYAQVSMSVSSKDGGWGKMLPFIEQIVRQAVEHGFSQAEIDEQLKKFDTTYANAAKSEATRDSGAFASSLVGLGDDIISSPPYLEKIWQQLRPQMTKPALDAEFAKWFGRFDRPQIFLNSKTAQEAEKDKLLAAFAESRKVAVTAPVERPEQKFAYTDFGPAGKIVEDRQIADLGIRTIRFANGVRLNLKQTDFEDNRVRYSLRIDGGGLLFGKARAPLWRLMSAAYVSGGLAKHEIEDLKSLMAGTTVNSSFSVGDDYFGGYGVVAPDDLEKQMQVMAAFASDPGYHQNAIRLYRRPLPEVYATLYATPGSALSIDAGRIMNDNDPRFSLPPLDTLMTLDFKQLKSALGNALVQNPMEIGLVGDFNPDQAIAAVARTFGAMPARLAKNQDYSNERIANFSSKNGSFDIAHKGEKDQLGWRRVWITDEDKDQKRTQTMDLLARVITVRLIDELREKLGATYGASASSNMSDVYTGRGTFSISTNGDPKDITAIESTVDAIIQEILAAPVDADIFERARKPVLESYADWRERNATWIGYVAEAQSRPDQLDRFRQSEDQFKSITADDLWQMAKLYLAKPARYTFRAIPESQLKPAQLKPDGQPEKAAEATSGQ